MFCNKCKKEVNELRWYEILVNGEHSSYGGKASNKKKDIAISMKHTDFMMGTYNNDKIEYISYRHCFNCGYPNYKRVILI